MCTKSDYHSVLTCMMRFFELGPFPAKKSATQVYVYDDRKPISSSVVLYMYDTLYIRHDRPGRGALADMAVWRQH